jgi:ABC-type phosphate transport system substrate-binding protein
MRVTRSSDAQTQTRTYLLQGAEPDAACFRISVRSTGSDTAKDAIVDKAAQIGMSSRVYTDNEIQVLAKAADATPVARSEIEQVVALDGVVVVVNDEPGSEHGLPDEDRVRLLPLSIDLPNR